MEEKNTFYSPAEVSALLDVSTSTVRRLTSALEDEGYSRITRNEKNHRRYDISDVRAVEYLHKRITDGGLTQKEAVKDTLNNIDYVLNKIEPIEVSENKDNQLKELMDKMNVLIEIVGGLNNKIAENNKLIENQNKVISEVMEENKRLSERLPAPTTERLPYAYEDAIDENKDEYTNKSEETESVDNKGVSDTVSDEENSTEEGAHKPITDDIEAAEDVNESQSEEKKKPSLLARLFGKK